MSDFKSDLTLLINRFSRENKSDTPDYILAEYMEQCLKNYEITIKARDAWYEFDPWEKLKNITK